MIMRPNHTYSFVGKLAIWPDSVSLSTCYQPIIGLQAFALYHYLCVSNDQGFGRYRFSQILNHLNFGTQALEQAFDLLTAMKLLSIYQKDEEFILVLQAPLSKQEFLNNELYRALLVKKIGESAVEQMKINLPNPEKNISKPFSEVFQMDGQIDPLNNIVHRFDLGAFKQTMARNHLMFQDEETDIIGLYHLAEQENWTWMDAYQVARQTAVNHKISLKRMQEKVLSEQKQETTKGPFSASEEAIIRESKSLLPLDFLTAIKSSKKAAVIASEKKCLTELANLGLLNEVINIIVLYTFNKVDSANLNEKYALKLGNDFSYKEIRTAELAIEALRDRSKPGAKKENTNQTSNVPSWSQEEVDTKQTEAGQAKLAALYRELEEMESKGGNA